MLTAMQFATFFVTAILYGCWFLFGSNAFLEWAVLGVFALCVLFAAKDYRKRLVLLLFLASVFLFLLGTVGLHVLGVKSAYMGGPGLFERFPPQVVGATLHCVFLSLAALFVGVVLGESGSRPPKPSLAVRRGLDNVKSVRSVSLGLFYLTMPAVLAGVVQKALFVHTWGYLALYTTYTGAPPIIDKMIVANAVCLFVFLGTMPDKQHVRLPVCVYLAVNGLTLLSGARNDAVIAILVVAFYYVYRSAMNAERQSVDAVAGHDDSPLGGVSETWIGRLERRLAIVGIPLGVVFLSFWGYYRMGVSIGELGLPGLLAGLTETQGGSINVVAYAVSLAQYLPSTNTSYVFGPIVNWANGSVLALVADGPVTYAQNTISMALYGNNFGQTVSYMVMPANYLAGVGLGSSYIAELFVDFGYWGVVAYNLVLGFVLGRYSSTLGRGTGPFTFAVLMIVLQGVLFMPRDTALAWLMGLLNFTTLGVLVVIRALAEVRMRRRAE